MATRTTTPSVAGHLAAARPPFDAQLAELAAARHLVFGLAELVDLGLSPRAVRDRAAIGRLHRVHVGVYALIPPALLIVSGRYRAATIACGPTAALSHRSAADLHGLRASHRRTVEVIVPGRSTHRHAGIEVHRGSRLDRDVDVVLLDGIRTTTVARTLLDLASVLAPRQLERALDQAEILRVFDLTALTDQRRRNLRHPGSRPLRLTLDRHLPGTTPTASELEERMLALTDALGLPRAEINAYVDPGDGGPIIRPDCVWRVHRLAVEVDGARTHLTRHAFETDRHRDQRLVAAGWRVIRITWRQLTHDPTRIADLLTGLLERYAPA
jgi:predicted transcriptional regulator of viral defense system